MDGRGIALIGAGLLLGVLSLVAVANARGPEAPVVDGAVFAAADEGDGAGTTALVSGPVRLADGCVLLGDIPVIWPYGTTWDAGSESVRLADGQVVAVGQRVTGGGGFTHVDELAPTNVGEFADRLRGCPTDRWGQVAVFNRDAVLDVRPAG